MSDDDAHKFSQHDRDRLTACEVKLEEWKESIGRRIDRLEWAVYGSAAGVLSLLGAAIMHLLTK